MTFKVKVGLLFLILFVVLVIHYGMEPEGLEIGAVAPDFTLLTESGRSISLSSFRGRAILLNFWATWCPSCVAEMPSLERWGQTSNIAILAISVDRDWNDVRAFLKRLPVQLTILLDQSMVAERYGVSQIPVSFLIDPNGVIVEKYRGPREWQ